ncbi:hypothetical protein VCX83_19510 [Aeromonas caviae]|uniref:hypothetical protein n=1 Tax=Aeromonas caviae TaxID=648 RepID=UPI002B24D204|nr:hypothetical protein [Aeromonas caviae]MEA9424038.1 hypothetical protein [Aeromonas caviae]
MSTTAKIDFEPGLFDEGQYEEAPDLPAIQPKRRTNRAPFIVAGGLLLVGAVSAAFLLHKNLKEKETAFTQERYGDGARAILRTREPEPRMAPTGIIASMQPLSSSARWCDGDEVICTTTTSGKPVETLQKLIAAIPQNSAKQYRIRLAVVPVDEPDLVNTTEPPMHPN